MRDGWQVFLPALALTAGCFRPELPREEQLREGCIFMLPGIESGSWQLERPYYGLRDAGITQAIRIIEWGDRPLWLGNLTDYAKNQQRAAAIAREIADYQERYPGRPTTLIGYSGGGGIAVLAAERLPAGTRLDRLILIAAALSPGYDLREARLRCRLEIINFHSDRDVLVLGWGTGLFGTIDRKRVASAGRCGFDSSDLPEGVSQIAWTRPWIRLGNDGGHGGWLAQAWSREVLAAYIPDRSSGSPSPLRSRPD